MENNELIELYLKQLPLNVAKIINEKIKVQTNFKDCITTNDFKGLKEIFSNNEHIYLSLKEKLEIPHDLHEILQDNLNNIYYKYIVDFYLKNYQSNIAKLFINYIIKNADIYWDVARICHFSTCLLDTSNKKLIDELCVNPKIDFRTVIIGSLYNKDKNVFLYAFKNFNKIDYFSKNLILRPLLLTPYMVENNMKFNIESWDFYFEYYKSEIFLIYPELCEKDSFRKVFNKLILNNNDKDFCVYLLKKYKKLVS